MLVQSLGRMTGNRTFRSYGLFVWSYTSRMALITVSGSSNWMYSELLRAKICLEFEDSASQRAGQRSLLLIFEVLRRVRGLLLQVADAVVPGREHANGPGVE